MREIQLNTDRGESCTMLPDLFIEQHMPHANGEFVKIYIYLLQMVQQKRGQFSLAETADVFSCTERDITRAIRYWEARGLIEVNRSPEDQTIAGIRFVFSDAAKPAQTVPQEAAGQADSEPRTQAYRELQAQPDSGLRTQQNREPGTQPAEHNSRPAKAAGSQIVPALSNDRTGILMRDQADVRQIVTIAEQYLGRTLSSTDLNRLLYLYDELHFSVDLIDYLIEYCVLKEKRSMHYIEKVGLEWYNDGVKTTAEARERTITWSRDYFRILRAFGITNRSPVTKETAYMKKWLKDFGLSMELIREACERTVTQTGHARFDYADKILTSWHAAGVKSLAEVAVLDQKHTNRTSASQNPPGRAGGQLPSPSAAGNRFNNFTQRDYDFQSLEQQLLRSQQTAQNSDSDSPANS
ncbi:MAG: DnaD domain protein [Eubacterium sp.]|nr:DnaD domain protein [Eubacterium sp.]